MNMKEKIKTFAKEMVYTWKSLNKSQNDRHYNLNFTAAELIRNTHSIEKGLSIAKPRLGFGHTKQKEMMSQIKELKDGVNTPYYDEICNMAMSALQEYLEYHKEKGYTDDFCSEIEAFISEYFTNENKSGGTVTISKSDMDFNIPDIEKLFNSRHSIRDFDSTDVDDSILKKALILAQRSPSACNRQGYRAYVLSREKTVEFTKILPGICSGFIDQVPRFILIVGKKSSYRDNENYQYIVSASIFAAYLTLTLHLYGLGACCVQRPVQLTKEWESARSTLKLDNDEQLILLLAVGNLRDCCTVPFSHRLSFGNTVSFIE